MIVLRPFFIPRRQPPKLFEAVDQPLDPVALAVECPIKWASTTLVRFMRNGDADAASPQIRPDFPTAVALIANQPLGVQPRSPASGSLDPSLLHQRLKRRRFMPLAWREHNGQGLAVAVAAQMDLGAEPPLAAPERLGLWVPLFAPAACWWARMTVAST